MKLYLSSILFLVFSSVQANAQIDSDTIKVSTDSVQVPAQKDSIQEKHFQYFRIGIDVSKLVASSITNKYNAVEFQLDAIWKKDFHYVLETGLARANTKGANIQFQSSSYFLRAGFDKYFFGSLYKGDLDNAFIGLRLGGALLKRDAAVSTLWDPFYGNTQIVHAGSNHLLYWLGLTAGFRMELTKNIFLGWNVRGKSFINPKKIEERTPEFLAGYGAAKKQPSFDYNLYLLFGFGKR